MTRPELRQFIEEIMDIQPSIAGLTGAASAIIGSTGMEGMAGEKLRTDALAFAAEYSRQQPDRTRLIQLARELEGSLLTVKAVSGISDATLDRLTTNLHALLA